MWSLGLQASFFYKSPLHLSTGLQPHLWRLFVPAWVCGRQWPQSVGVGTAGLWPHISVSWAGNNTHCMSGKVEKEVEKDRLDWSLVLRSCTLLFPESVPGAARDVGTRREIPDGKMLPWEVFPLRMGPIAVTGRCRRDERPEMERSKDSVESDNNEVWYIRKRLS